MRLPFSCMKCTFESGLGSVSPYPTYIELRDDGRYEFTCANGHTTITVVQEQKFEVLYDLGAYAIVDGYYREAIASFTSSLERFYEFFIKACLFEDGIDKEVFDQAWKNVSRQSERQLGAFIFLYCKAFSEPPVLLRQKLIELRNDVIHKGKIPSKEEAMAYGESILCVIRPILKRVKNEFPNGVQASVFNHLMESRKSDENQQVTTMSIATIISLNNGEDKEPTLEESLSNKKWWRDRW
ncbi:hypothetical protein [Pseudoalteromonas undina]|uniref:hypothetical protein n=1 Tax=Pseudoalteromonas undina TaxID=43660 RepID=UPI000AD06721|nr:hypothetical protein [Pseudoalteromonas undina]